MINKIPFSSHYCVVIYCDCFGETGASLNIMNDRGNTALDLVYSSDSDSPEPDCPRTVEILTAAGDLMNTNHLK